MSQTKHIKLPTSISVLIDPYLLITVFSHFHRHLMKPSYHQNDDFTVHVFVPNLWDGSLEGEINKGRFHHTSYMHCLGQTYEMELGE
ncbi:hypothetical protein AQUCO_00100513v1 [Aquilegia coerulea]|uniref:Uncharacterized protein n=1 Tax=Aquilegia coerulea TaxID=218851 RepID=A0A2G5FAW1_AQUCA|nr:hypothetical protein AQUCO_00100513v1 [Aquilegia coerulea]